MTRAYVSAALRREVTKRADARCEYCRFPQEASLLAFEVEHIVAEKHGGATVANNLALACPYCNRYKGTDLGSLDPRPVCSRHSSTLGVRTGTSTSGSTVR